MKHEFLERMKNIIQFLLIFLIFCVKAKELKKDTLYNRVTDIETVIINNKDYEKIDYYFGLKQENNVRFMPITNYEEGVKFKNKLEKKGRINSVTLFLHKTDSKVNLTNLEINFYKIDSLSGLPKEKINKKQIIFIPQNKGIGKVNINVLDYNLLFPLGGVFVSIKWLPNKFNDKKVGPSLRETNYEEQITYVRYKDGDWHKNLNISREQNLYTNAMMGLEVYIKRRKNND